MNGLNYLAILGCAACLGGAALAEPRQITITDDYSTVYGIAHEHGVPTQSIVSANNLKPPYALSKGQELTIPLPNEHIVGNGETLEQVADKYGVSSELLAQDNDMRSVRDGDHLTIPSRDTEPMAGAERLAGPSIQASSLEPLPLVPAEDSPVPSRLANTPSTTPLPPELAEEIAREKQTVQAPTQTAPSKPSSVGNLAATAPSAPLAASTNKPKEKPAQPKPVAEKPAPKNPQTAVAEPEKKAPPKTKSAEAKQFIWPLKGPVISKFSSGKNDGINISAPVGTPVRASAPGTVMYAGSELKGFGNLLLIKHEGGWITAYAHNSKLLVKKGAKVTQGQNIAHSGRTGDVNEPQLHFEVRKGKQPVDPTPKLGS